MTPIILVFMARILDPIVVALGILLGYTTKNYFLALPLAAVVITVIVEAMLNMAVGHLFMPVPALMTAIGACLWAGLGCWLASRRAAKKSKRN
jgi:hypothetical protein